jgi:hypothetical protein
LILHRGMREMKGTPPGEMLIARIRGAVPVPLVPLIAHAILHRQDGDRTAADGTGTPPPLDDAAVIGQVTGLVDALGGAGLFLAFDRTDLAGAVRFELQVLRRRKILAPGPTIDVVGDGPDLLTFYANSVAHHLAAPAKAAKVAADVHQAPEEFEPT